MAIGTVLILAGTVVRLTFSPGAAEVSWTPAPETAGELPTLEQTIRAVDEELARRAEARMPLEPGERLDPNSAPAHQLERLPGIGPAKAFAIVEERRKNGPYTEPADLGRVSGIGAALLERLAPYLALRSNPASRAVLGTVRRSQPVNINQVGREQLQELPGIGPVRAESIIAYRERTGGFRSVSELMEVAGIGAAILRGLQGRIVTH